VASLVSLSHPFLSLSLSLSPFLSLLSTLFLRAYQKARQLCHNRVLLALNTSVPLIYCSRPACSFVSPFSFLFSVSFLSGLSFYRVAKTHRIPYLYGSFSAKVTYI